SARFDHRNQFNWYAVAQSHFLDAGEIAHDRLGVILEPERLAFAALQYAVVGSASDDSRASTWRLDLVERSRFVERPLDRQLLTLVIEHHKLGVLNLLDADLFIRLESIAENCFDGARSGIWDEIDEMGRGRRGDGKRNERTDDAFHRESPK